MLIVFNLYVMFMVKQFVTIQSKAYSEGKSTNFVIANPHEV